MGPEGVQRGSSAEVQQRAACLRDVDFCTSGNMCNCSVDPQSLASVFPICTSSLARVFRIRVCVHHVTRRGCVRYLWLSVGGAGLTFASPLFPMGLPSWAAHGVEFRNAWVQLEADQVSL